MENRFMQMNAKDKFIFIFLATGNWPTQAQMDSLLTGAMAGCLVATGQEDRSNLLLSWSDTGDRKFSDWELIIGHDFGIELRYVGEAESAGMRRLYWPTLAWSYFLAYAAGAEEAWLQDYGITASTPLIRWKDKLTAGLQATWTTD